jgi:hypothetical protein
VASIAARSTARATALYLPGDSGQLPPLGRHLVFQVLDQGRIRVRVYDEQKLPDGEWQAIFSRTDYHPVVLEQTVLFLNLC